MIGALALSCALAAVQTANEPRTLKAALVEMSRKAGIHAVAVDSLAGEKVSPPPIDEITAENVEEKLLAMVAKLQTPARVVRFHLPKGHNWTADEILAYGRAEATLLKKKVGNLGDDFEVLGHKVAKDRIAAVTEALDLRTVYVILVSRAFFGGTWQTTYGTMRLEQKGTRVTGTYTTNNGQIQGDVKDNEFRFIWFEQGNGTGGKGVVTLSDDGMSFAGPWYTHENPTNQAGIWTGKRVVPGAEQQTSNAGG